ncbi:MAG: hypothetical protein U9O50_09305 [Acidobacteriota bacterium]|nr:hypothetical protein [Acidobacteriota bacterium]
MRGWRRFSQPLVSILSFCHEKKKLTFLVGNISIPVTVNYEGLICHSDGSPPSEAHCGGWEGLGKDGGEPSLHFSIKSDISLITEMEVLTFACSLFDNKSLL